METILYLPSSSIDFNVITYSIPLSLSASFSIVAYFSSSNIATLFVVIEIFTHYCYTFFHNLYFEYASRVYKLSMVDLSTLNMVVSFITTLLGKIWVRVVHDESIFLFQLIFNLNVREVYATIIHTTRMCMHLR